MIDQPSPKELERQMREFEAGWKEMTDQSFYQMPPLQDLIQSGWLDFYLAIPEFQRKITKNSFLTWNNPYRKQ